MNALLLLSLAGAIIASPCPYGKLAERGELSAEDSAKFFAARSEGESAVEAQMKIAKREEHAAQAQYYKRQVEARQLPLGMFESP